ncbi:GNAT family N-acetyltransferase [Streptomyces sp. NPDC093591]|uniref:GNAT family N-acetyltransferase n=1 Tax=Streptomyces sp. NPDC093591 TaxID=3366044 RepID=UPI0038104895
MTRTPPWPGKSARTWHEHAMADPDQERLIAVHAGTPVGFIVPAGLSRADGTVELHRHVVDPARRRAGRGRALRDAAVAHARGHHGARDVWLDVQIDSLRARALYESEGFVVTSDFVRRC